jgi:hypothetical protein
MTPFTRLLTAGLQALALLALAPSSRAAPGAHGPNGEHLEAPATPASGSRELPRFEVSTETFELVGRLQARELSIFINRFETNEPVIRAAVEVETGTLKATAAFRADPGDYVVDDPVLLETISKPGSHSLVLTVIAGADTDLLEATLTVTPGQDASAQRPVHAWWENRRIPYVVLGLATALLVAWLLVRRRTAAAAQPQAAR